VNPYDLLDRRVRLIWMDHARVHRAVCGHEDVPHEVAHLWNRMRDLFPSLQTNDPRQLVAFAQGLLFGRDIPEALSFDFVLDLLEMLEAAEAARHSAR
jgi:hypothetical protein